MRIKLICAITLALCACTSKHTGDQADVLARVGAQALTRSELRNAVPGGLSSSDSTAFARVYIRNWINNRLIADIATEDVDLEEIDRLTAEYRLNLIMSDYRRSMASRVSEDFNPDSLYSYYLSHKAEYVLERPLVKGVYLKIPSDASNLRTLLRLYTSSKTADLDKLEKEAPKTALHYDYFRERWVDWEQIETRLPVEIGSPKEFLEKGKPLNVSADGYIYLLDVSQYLPAGATMPFEAAEPLIREKLLSHKRLVYDTMLLNGLFERAIDKGSLQFPNGNPL